VSQQLVSVRERLDGLMKAIYECFQRQLLPVWHARVLNWWIMRT